MLRESGFRWILSHSTIKTPHFSAAGRTVSICRAFHARSHVAELPRTVRTLFGAVRWRSSAVVPPHKQRHLVHSSLRPSHSNFLVEVIVPLLNRGHHVPTVGGVPGSAWQALVKECKIVSRYSFRTRASSNTQGALDSSVT